MEAQELSLKSEIFEEFNVMLNHAIKAILDQIIAQNVKAGSIAAKIDISMQYHTDENGEIHYTPKIEPRVSMKIGAKDDFKMKPQHDFILQSDGRGSYLVATHQMDIDELMKERKRKGA